VTTVLLALAVRWALWGLFAQLVGAVFVAFSFRLSPTPSILTGIGGREYPHLMVLADRPWFHKLGWFLIVLGTALQGVPDLLAVLRAGG
jgi:hypothetical protein